MVNSKKKWPLFVLAVIAVGLLLALWLGNSTLFTDHGLPTDTAATTTSAEIPTNPGGAELPFDEVTNGTEDTTVPGEATGETVPNGSTAQQVTESSADASAGSTGTSMTADGGSTTKEPTKAPTQVTTSKTKATTKTTKALTTTKKANGTTKKPIVVQIADPKTGISWDGKSPIIYTYPDGSTGTVPKDGATYEQVPGMVATYYAPTPTSTTHKRGYCSHCGKKAGDGSNGTCKRYWAGGDHTCACCGDTIPEDTCHTCE